jgi:hypothetical protein
MIGEIINVHCDSIWLFIFLEFTIRPFRFQPKRIHSGEKGKNSEFIEIP